MEKDKKGTESLAGQAIEWENRSVENFFGLKGQEQEKQTEKSKIF